VAPAAVPSYRREAVSKQEQKMRITSLDHIVLVVASIERTLAFYTRILGMQALELRPGRWALHFGNQKLNLQELGVSVDPLAKVPTPGSADFCLLTDVPIEEVVAHLVRYDVPLVDGPVRRTGAVGPLQSVYFYDPDRNLVEVSNQLAPGPGKRALPGPAQRASQ
jgi:catechol 2,3-dioxygenase-like lactoylglutathione lyase family enzyme